MKIFILTDNYDIFLPIYDVIKNNIKKDIDIKYFCNPTSKNKFKDFDFIKQKNIKDDYKDLLRFDIGFSIHSKMIFPKELVEKVPCFNLHPGFNPYNRGIFPHVFSMINKLKAGASLHIMDSKIDNGKIIDREEIAIKSYDDSLSLYKKILNLEVKLFKRNIDSIINKTYKFIDIDSTDSNYNSMNDFKNLCKINLDKILTMQEAIDYLRALSHKPYKNAYFIDKNGDKIFVSLKLQKDNIIKNPTMGGGCLKNRILDKRFNLLLKKSA